MVVTSTGIVHIDQSGRRSNAAVNAWWEYTTTVTANTASEERRLALDGSRAQFVSERDMLLVLQNGNAHQVRFEMDGRAVGTIKVDEQSSSVPPPSSLVITGKEGVFIGSSEGDSLLARVDLIREQVEVDASKKEEMELDWDEDLYGEADAPTANGSSKAVVPTGPATVTLTPQDVLAGIGRISDMEFGIAVTDQGTRTYPQLVALGGGSNGSTLNVFRRGIPITKRRRVEQLASVNAVFFLPVQRPGAQKFKGIPEAEQTTILFASDGSQTRIYSLSTKSNQDQIGRIGEPTIAAGTFFQRSSIVHVTPSQVFLLDSDAEVQHTICPQSDLAPIVAASIADPYLVIKRADGSITLFVGDSVARTVTQADVPTDTELPLCQSAEVFTDTTGVYRTFEATQQNGTVNGTDASSKAYARNQRNARRQLTGEQLKRLQDAKPAIAADQATTESAFNSSRGTQWLATLSINGELQVRSAIELADSRSDLSPT